jgi:hypothetical protein
MFAASFLIGWMSRPALYGSMSAAMLGFRSVAPTSAMCSAQVSSVNRSYSQAL